MVATGAIQYALVIGAEKLSAWLDWTDRNTCVLFGDGGGACVLGRRPDDRVGRGILSTFMGSDGEYAQILGLPGGGTRCPITKDNIDQRLNTLKMMGKETFKQAVNAMTSASLEVLDRTGLTVDDIACIIPHQANFRIIDAIADRLSVSTDRFFSEPRPLREHRRRRRGHRARRSASRRAHQAGRQGTLDCVRQRPDVGKYGDRVVSAVLDDGT